MGPNRLRIEDWLDAALQVLATEGHGALRALPLAARLGVTRGSFYHHFSSLEVFHQAVVAHWAKRTSGPVIDGLASYADPAQALSALLHKTLNSGEALERAIRAWATIDDHVAQAVDRVDRERIGVAEALLVAAGIPGEAAAGRARLLYWAAIGRLSMPFPDAHRLTPGQIDDLTALVLRKSNRSDLTYG